MHVHKCSFLHAYCGLLSWVARALQSQGIGAMHPVEPGSKVCGENSGDAKDPEMAAASPTSNRASGVHSTATFWVGVS